MENNDVIPKCSQMLPVIGLLHNAAGFYCVIGGHYCAIHCERSNKLVMIKRRFRKVIEEM